MLKKILVVTLALAMSISIFSACGNQPGNTQPADSKAEAPKSSVSTESNNENNNARPFEGQEIVYACEAGGIFTEFYRSIISEFEETTGIKVTFFEVAHENTYERFLTEAMAGTGSIDVYQLDQPWISAFASMGFLEEVNDQMKAGVTDFDDFSDSALGTMSYDHKLYGLPFQYHTPVLFYRTDLFEAAGLAGPPETWEQYREYAKILNDPANDVFGTCLEAKAAPEPVTHLLDKLAQNGAHYMNPDAGSVIFDSPETRDTFQFLYDIQNVDKTSPPGAVGYDNTDVYTVFLQGRAAMVSQWPYFYAASQDPSQSVIVGKVGVATQPAGKNKTSALWAFGHGVSSASNKKDAAWEFCKWSTESDVLARLSIAQTTPVPRTSANEIVYASNELTEETKGVLKALTEAANNAVSYTVTPNFPAVQSRLFITLSNIMSGIKTIDEEVMATQKDLEDIIK